MTWESLHFKIDPAEKYLISENLAGCAVLKGSVAGIIDTKNTKLVSIFLLFRISFLVLCSLITE